MKKLFLASAIFSALSLLISCGDGNTVTIDTTELADSVRGFCGPTPLKITISDNKITNIESLANSETPAYYAEAEKGIFEQVIGKSVDEVGEIDAVSGATYSSNAIIKNIKVGLQHVK